MTPDVEIENHLPLPVETALDEDRLVERSWRPLLLACFVMISVISTTLTILHGRRSVVETVIECIVMTGCMFIGMSILLFAAWGVLVLGGKRLNWMFDKPLNPSAVAALTASGAFAFAHTIMSGALFIDTNSTEVSLLPLIAIAISGLLLIQVFVRVSIENTIAHHNAIAGRKIYTEPPCEIQFRIRQVMVMTFVLSVGLALLTRTGVEFLLPILLTWTIATAVLFYPAAIISRWFVRRFCKVKLATWEQPRLAGLATLRQSTAAKKTDKDVTSVTVGPEYPQTKFPESQALSAAAKWIGFGGGAFGLLLLPMIEISLAANGENSGQPMYFAILLGLAACIYGLVLSTFLLAGLRVINILLGERFRTGSIAAIAGSLVGTLGTSLICGIFELFHYDRFDGTIDLTNSANLFPLAIILLAAVTGQTLGRYAVKRHGFRAGLLFETYQNNATIDRCRDSLCQITVLLVICCAVVWERNSMREGSIDTHMVTFLAVSCGATLAIWPWANFLVRIARVAPKPSAADFCVGARKAKVSAIWVEE